MNEFIYNLKDSVDLDYINIIMRDFINDDKVMEIVLLNEYKGVLGSNYNKEFEK